VRKDIRPYLGIALGFACLLAGCDSGSGSTLSASEINDDFVLPRVDGNDCSVDVRQFVDGGVPPGGIPSLSDLELVGKDAVDNFLSDGSRVIGFFVDGKPIAVPHNILWYHEVANMDVEGAKLAVTYCPLTGSSMAFDRSVVGGVTFGVSGLLFLNNLVMFERNRNASLWPQMNKSAGCGVRFGTPLPMYPVLEMTWAGWKSLHPDTRVVSSNTGFVRNYTDTGYPFGNYEDLDNASILDGRIKLDPRRPPKERLLGIPARTGDGGIAFPFGALDEAGVAVRAVRTSFEGKELVVFWDSVRRGAMAYRPVHNGQVLTFSTDGDVLVDAETGSRWHVDGQAVAGPLSGTQLDPVAEAYVSFWFAWAVFQPATLLWTGS